MGIMITLLPASFSHRSRPRWKSFSASSGKLCHFSAGMDVGTIVRSSRRSTVFQLILEKKASM